MILNSLQVPTFSYPRFVQLLQLSCYSKYIISGLVISIGGLQDSLRKASLSALLDYLQSTETEGQNNSREFALSTDILWVLQNYKRCDRVIIPTLKVITPKLMMIIAYLHDWGCASNFEHSTATKELRRKWDFSRVASL